MFSPIRYHLRNLKNNEWLKDLAIISDLNVATIKTSGDRDKQKHKRDINFKT